MSSSSLLLKSNELRDGKSSCRSRNPQYGSDFFFFSLRGFRDRVRECHPDDENQDVKSVLDSRELRKSRPVTYFMISCSISSERAAACQRSQCLEQHHREIWGQSFVSPACSPLVLPLVTKEVQNGVQKQRSYGILMILGCPVLWRKTDSVHAQRSMQAFLHMVLMLCCLYTGTMMLSGAKNGCLKHVSSYLALPSMKFSQLVHKTQLHICSCRLQ